MDSLFLKHTYVHTYMYIHVHTHTYLCVYSRIFKRKNNYDYQVLNPSSYCFLNLPTSFLSLI